MRSLRPVVAAVADVVVAVVVGGGGGDGSTMSVSHLPVFGTWKSLPPVRFFLTRCIYSLLKIEIQQIFYISN